MDYGIGIPSYIEAWREVKAAEEAGFTHAWFFDSQLIYSDVWATMALAAQHTSRIKLGTLVAIPSNRLAPVTAAAAASINRIAPGRVIVGLGTGLHRPEHDGSSGAEDGRVRGVRAAGEGAAGRGGRSAAGGEPGAVDTADSLQDPTRDATSSSTSKTLFPVMLAANGPRGQKITGEVADGWITTARSASVPRRTAQGDGGGGSDRQQFRPVRWTRRQALRDSPNLSVRS